jgi:hypothetical protein
MFMHVLCTGLGLALKLGGVARIELNYCVPVKVTFSFVAEPEPHHFGGAAKRCGSGGSGFKPEVIGGLSKMPQTSTVSIVSLQFYKNLNQYKSEKIALNLKFTLVCIIKLAWNIPVEG